MREPISTPPVHWVTGRDKPTVDKVPAEHLIAPAVVIDRTDEFESNPDYLLTVEHVKAWQKEHGALPEGGWLLFRTGWERRAQDAHRSFT